MYYINIYIHIGHDPSNSDHQGELYCFLASGIPRLPLTTRVFFKMWLTCLGVPTLTQPIQLAPHRLHSRAPPPVARRKAPSSSNHAWVEKHGEIPRWWIPISSMGVVYIPTFTIHFQPNGVWSIWGMVHLPTWMARIHGKLVGKYNIPVPLSIWEHLKSNYGIGNPKNRLAKPEPRSKGTPTRSNPSLLEITPYK